ncbi:MAG: hypothetical protein KTR18_01230 [Acidiferrobacterales bacterium]|nr:hypothetical protein [Acidiferrobacterales bacterium]
MTPLNLDQLHDLDAIAASLNQEFNPNQWPTISDIRFDGDTLSLALNVTSDLKWFEGHFPDNPVLPGVVQVHWAVSLAKKLLVNNADFNQVENLKFKSVVLPETNLTLHYTGLQSGEKIRFSFNASETGEVHSEGRLTFD